MRTIHMGGARDSMWLLLLLPLYADFVCSKIICLDRTENYDKISCVQNTSVLNFTGLFFKNKQCPACNIPANASYYAYVQAKCATVRKCVLLPHTGTWPLCNCSANSSQTHEICMDTKCVSGLMMLDLCNATGLIKQGYIQHAWPEITDTSITNCECILKSSNTTTLKITLLKLLLYAPNATESDCLNVSFPNQSYSYCGENSTEVTGKVIVERSTSHVQISLRYRSPLSGLIWLKLQTKNGNGIQVECHSSQQQTSIPSSTITTGETHSPSEVHVPYKTTEDVRGDQFTVHMVETTGYLSGSVDGKTHTENQPLSTGAAAGIAVVSIVVIAVLVGLAILCMRKSKLEKQNKNSTKEGQETNVDNYSSLPGIVLESQKSKGAEEINVDNHSSQPGIVIESERETQSLGDSTKTDDEIAAMYTKVKKSNKTTGLATINRISGTTSSPNEGNSDPNDDDSGQANDYEYVTAEQVQHSEPVDFSEDQTYYNVKTDNERAQQDRAEAPEDEAYYNLKTDNEHSVSVDTQYDHPRRHHTPNYENVPTKQKPKASKPTTEPEEKEGAHEDSDDDNMTITDNPLYT